MADKPTIAVIGGTGNLGLGLVRVWASAGYPVVVGSRSREKACEAARRLAESGSVAGDENCGAARAADIVVLSVPFASHHAIVCELKAHVVGKIVVDAVVPLVPPRVSLVQLPAEGPPAVVAQRILGPAVKVVSAFHNVGAKKLQDGERADCDVLVFGDDPDAREQIIALASVIATRG